MYQQRTDANLLDWQPLDFEGVSIRVLSKNAGGGMTVMTRMMPGATIPAHWHNEADETVFVLEGEFVEDGSTYQKGSYFLGKAKTSHGPHTTANGCLLLTTFSSQIDFQLQSQSPAPLD